MGSTDLALLGDVEHLRPKDLERTISDALEQNVSHESIAGHPGVQQAIEHFLNEFRKRKGMYEPTTLRRLESSWNMFVCYCNQSNKHSLPAKPSVVEKYLLERAPTRHRNTLNVDTWAISLMHRQAGCPDPTQDQYVRNTLRMLVREKIRHEEPIKQALAFNGEALSALTEKWHGSSRLIDIRNLALLSVAYESLLRESELANIRFSHLHYRNDGAAVLTIPNTKTNKSGDVEKTLLTPSTMEVVDRYVTGGDINRDDGGYLFRHVYRSGKVKEAPNDPITGAPNHNPLSKQAIEGVFVSAWLALNPSVDPRKEPNFRKRYRVYSGHSARVGAAQDLLAAGFDSLQVQQAGRWKSNTMVAQYGADVDVEKSAMAVLRLMSTK